MSLTMFPRHRRHESATDRTQLRDDQRSRRLDRQQEDLTNREAALNERERNIRARERRAEQEDNEGSPSGVGVRVDAGRPGVVVGAPGRVAQMIIAADAQRRGEVEVPGPALTGAAKMIAEAANTTTQQASPALDATAKLILNADARRRGAEIDEAI
jgi:hypothetical protein